MEKNKYNNREIHFREFQSKNAIYAMECDTG